ncbi:MAG: cytochrome oxidase subunit III [Chloroflexi bacterium]|nr:MAG: cytochrome oxidase subunit III [Chloroflexota bacterium]
MAQAVANDHGEHSGPKTHGAPGHPPTSLGLNNRKLGLWTFIGNETLFFTALITTYLVMKPRNIALGGPHPQEFLGITLTAILAFILLMSSLTMVLALAAVERDDQRGTRLWLGATILLGLMFLGGQAYEFNKLWHEEFTTLQITNADGTTERTSVPTHDEAEGIAALQREHPGAQIAPYPNPQEAVKPVTWTTSLFGTTFFTMTGFHGTHVAIGVVWLTIVLIMSFRGAISSRNSLTVELVGLYWHFVDLVWVAIFTLIYLI